MKDDLKELAELVALEAAKDALGYEWDRLAPRTTLEGHSIPGGFTLHGKVKPKLTQRIPPMHIEVTVTLYEAKNDICDGIMSRTWVYLQGCLLTDRKHTGDRQYHARAVVQQAWLDYLHSRGLRP